MKSSNSTRNWLWLAAALVFGHLLLSYFNITDYHPSVEWLQRAALITIIGIPVIWFIRENAQLSSAKKAAIKPKTNKRRLFRRIVEVSTAWVFLVVTLPAIYTAHFGTSPRLLLEAQRHEAMFLSESHCAYYYKGKLDWMKSYAFPVRLCYASDAVKSVGNAPDTLMFFINGRKSYFGLYLDSVSPAQR